MQERNGNGWRHSRTERLVSCVIQNVQMRTCAVNGNERTKEREREFFLSWVLVFRSIFFL